MKQWQVSILIVLVAVVTSLVLVEMGLRLLGIEYPIFSDIDPHLGHTLRPGVKGYYLEEGRGYVSINSDGLKDREHPVSHPANTLRIAVLGDSYAEAMQVNQDEGFCAVMEKALQRCENLSGRNIEVINFGQAGFGTTQELLSYQYKAMKYSPDVVLLEFTTRNDVSDNSRALKKDDDYLPYHVYQGDKLVLDDRLTRENWVAKHDNLYHRLHVLYPLRVFQIIKHSTYRFWKWRRVHGFGKVGSADAKGEEYGISDSIYREPTTEVWKEAWRVTEGVLLLLRAEVVRHGAQFFVVTATDGIQVTPNVSDRVAFTKNMGVSDLFYTEHRLQNFYQSHNIPILVLGPIFQEYATRHQVFLHGFGKTLGGGHWNQNGHRLAGLTIARWLCPQLK